MRVAPSPLEVLFLRPPFFREPVPFVYLFLSIGSLLVPVSHLFSPPLIMQQKVFHSESCLTGSSYFAFFYFYSVPIPRVRFGTFDLASTFPRLRPSFFCIPPPKNPPLTACLGRFSESFFFFLCLQLPSHYFDEHDTVPTKNFLLFVISFFLLLFRNSHTPVVFFFFFFGFSIRYIPFPSPP